MSGKYDWKPGQGIRSVGDVFNWIVVENGMLVGVLSEHRIRGHGRAHHRSGEIAGSSGRASYVNLQKAITGLSDDVPAGAGETEFRRDMTKQGALMLLLEDQHEHLGQSIAYYARSNGVVPPLVTSRSGAGVIWPPPIR